jgi:dTDP-4-amino-4,6-dideoxygalactose transaminase
MAALHLSYLALGIGPGDEVIVPAQTHIATVHAVEWVGAQPVFVDCDPRSGNVTPEGVAAAITPRTRAISVVHFIGIPCDMPGIMAVAEAHGLKVVEDCALAVGARYGETHVGLFGDAGCFSFYPVKHLTTGEGGMFVTRHPEVAGVVGNVRAFGVDRGHAEREMPGLYDVVRLGLNYRMSELQAALGRAQLKRIDEILERRRNNFVVLKRALWDVPHIRVLDAPRSEARSSHYCLTLVLEGPLGKRRNDLVRQLNAVGVGTSVYYPRPAPGMRYYQEKYGYDPGRFPQAAAISDCSIALPVAPHVGAEDIEHMAEAVRRLLREVSV